MLNVELGTEIFESLVVELLAIVSDDGMRESISTNYQLSEETPDLALGDVHEGLCLHSFSKVVDSDDKESLLPGCQEEGAKYVHSPLDERLGRGKLV